MYNNLCSMLMNMSSELRTAEYVNTALRAGLEVSRLMMVDPDFSTHGDQHRVICRGNCFARVPPHSTSSLYISGIASRKIMSYARYKRVLLLNTIAHYTAAAPMILLNSETEARVESIPRLRRQENKDLGTHASARRAP